MARALLVIFLCFLMSRGNAQLPAQDSSRLINLSPQVQMVPGSLQFIVMGDWGRNGADHQKEVAAVMAAVANRASTQFVIATGDNFYPSGVISEWDPSWKYSFEDIYTDFRLQWDWYPVLGNHDYKSNPQAQVAYSKISRRWQMPARYYFKKMPIGSDTTQQVLLAFIDTNPLIPEFYSNREYGPNVRTQDTSRQKRWLTKVMADPSPAVKWKFVIGHHPMYSAGGRTDSYDTRAIRGSLEPLFEKWGVDFYLAGHEHSLQHLEPGRRTHHFISGAASEKTFVHPLDIARMAAAEYGFMLFTVTATSVLVQVIDYKGSIIYSTTIKK